jgi:K+ transporter
MRKRRQSQSVQFHEKSVSRPISRESLAALTLDAMGVVYGDIGTSPRYTTKKFSALPPVSPDWCRIGHFLGTDASFFRLPNNCVVEVRTRVQL